MTAAPDARPTRLRALACALLLAHAGAASAQESLGGQTAFRTGVFASDDADDTTVLKASAGVVFDWVDVDHYRGVVVEDVRIRPLGGAQYDEQRMYLTAAGGNGLKWKAHVGTDGDTLLGNASLVFQGHVGQEYFVERDLLETRQGIEGLHHTFVGGAWDVPLGRSDRHQVTALLGAQDFTGANLRTHARLRYVAVVRRDWGLSLQLRTRAFRNSKPFEADYYSPEWFVEAMPTVQLRRFHRRWMFSAALGVGRQRDSESDWRDARLVEASVTSPRIAVDGHLRGGVLYSNTPIGDGASYGYRQLSLEWVVPL
jgi:hypothetical protein